MKQSLFILVLIFSSFARSTGTSPLHHQYRVRGNSSLRGTTAHSFSYRYPEQAPAKDTVKILALMIEFQEDADLNTTGNGLFGIASNGDSATLDDKQELEWYAQDSVYYYDNLPHGRSYFSNHFQFLQNYYATASGDNLHIDWEIYPKSFNHKGVGAYKLPLKMAIYSPAQKRTGETEDDFLLRRTRKLMQYVKDALITADASDDSPFLGLTMDSSGTLYDSTGIETAIMLIHAGASYLTDGGTTGNANTPSDMIHAFINEPLFTYLEKDSTVFKGAVDTIQGITGVSVRATDSSDIVISNCMLIPETSNQDSLNYGINGILVNQFARYLGIPDLYTTSSGISAIGSFGIMDFAGYSAGQGFIPPHPSAWTRHYMGWETPVVAEFDSLISLEAVGLSTNPSMALVPINGHEYYLIEHRQRNLTGDKSLFLYDTTDDKEHISGGFQVNLKRASLKKSTDESRVILTARSQDIGIGGSGFLVWHIDEDIIHNRLQFNMLNADSTFRGVALEEADGITDLGITYSNALGGDVYDYGSGEDIFPHLTTYKNGAQSDYTYFMNDTTSPNTDANDGGHSYLHFSFEKGDAQPLEEYLFQRDEEGTKLGSYRVLNYVDSTLSFRVSRNDNANTVTIPGTWPQSSSPYPLFEPLLVDINSDTIQELLLIDSAGYLFAFADSGALLYPQTATTAKGAPFSYTFKLPSQPVSYPSALEGAVVLPMADSSIFMIKQLSEFMTDTTSIPLTSQPSTYCSIIKSEWVVGTVAGELLFGNDTGVTKTIPLTSNDPITAISRPTASVTLSVSQSGSISVLSNEGALLKQAQLTSNITGAEIFPPFSLATSDLDGDGLLDVVVTDAKQGLWIYTLDTTSGTLAALSGFQRYPNDWAGVYHLNTGRREIPTNGAAPSLADIDGDGATDILLAGTNGVYAFNHRGVLLDGWPAILDGTYWLQRGSVPGSPLVLSSDNGEPLTLFPAPSGDNITYAINKIIYEKPDPFHEDMFIAYYRHSESDNRLDSISNLDSLRLFDTLYQQNDSLLLPYYAPGGLIDARNATGDRPQEIRSTLTSGDRFYSHWPLSLGETIRSAPIAGDVDSDGKLDLFATTSSGHVYHWEYPQNLLSQKIWPMTGGNSGRSFSLSAPQLTQDVKSDAIARFYTYPNPVRITDETPQVTCRYELDGSPLDAEIQIYTVTGYPLYTEEVPAHSGLNEHILPERLISQMGSAPYRCRLKVEFASGEKSTFWKMVILRGRK
jgi:M6 family metalloprotease-like protein